MFLDLERYEKAALQLHPVVALGLALLRKATDLRMKNHLHHYFTCRKYKKL
jgi:hypothetical protein